MSKEMAKKAGMAAAENLLRSLMPELLARLDKLEAKIDRRVSELEAKLDRRTGELENRMDQLRQDMLDKFDQTRDVINELGQRIARVEGKIDAYAELTRDHNQAVAGLIERVTRLETVQPTKKRRAS